MDNLINDVGSGQRESAEDEGMTASWIPSVDIFEAQDEIVLRTELPGLNEEDVEITIENGRLALKGEKKFEKEETEGDYRRVESRYGSFYRSFALPNSVDREKIEAKFDKGVLNVTLPKAEVAKPKRIEVKANK
jgi:HSP20 family protein